MDVPNDLICSLLENPFSRWRKEDKKDLLNSDDFRPTPLLFCNKRIARPSGKTFNINFKRTWYTEYRWLCGSSNMNKLYCWPCLLLGQKKNVWNRTGFDDFVNATRSFHKHSDSAGHLKCMLNFKKLKNNLNMVGDELQECSRLHIENFNENVRLNRIIMKLVVRAILFLSKQELAFCEDNEALTSLNRDNFKELLNSFIEISSEEIRAHYGKIGPIFTGQSRTIQNEVIECIANYIKEIVEFEIWDSSFFSVEVDDMTDITQNTQCSIIFRYVTKKGKLVERFLGFHDVSSDRTLEGLFNVLESVLQPFAFQDKLIAQCYDGATVMAEHLNELQIKVKEVAPHALFIHCVAHRLNSVLQQSFSKNIPKCRVFFSTLSEIANFFHRSSKKTSLLKIIARHIPSAGETRWSSNSEVLKLAIENWAELRNIFATIMTDPDSDSSSVYQAVGFLNGLDDFEFTLLAMIFHNLFSLTDILFDVLQKKSLDINYCSLIIHVTVEEVKRNRNENYFIDLFEEAKAKTDLDQEIGERKYSSLAENELQTHYQVLYYEIVDNLLMEFHNRFHDVEKFAFVSLVDTSQFNKYKNEFPSSAFENLIDSYPKIFNNSLRLKNELEIFYSDESLFNLPINTVLSHLRERDVHEDVFKEVYKLFSLVLSLPSTCVSGEQSSSYLKRLKTYSSHTIPQQRISSLATIAIEKELLQELEQTNQLYDMVIDRFAALENHRIDLIYKK